MGTNRHRRGARLGRASAVIRDLGTWVGLTIGLVMWAGIILGMVEATLDSPLPDESYVWAILAFGAVGLIVFGRLAERTLEYRRNPPALYVGGGEREILDALTEYDQLTPTTAAMRTTLTADQASQILEKLAEKGRIGAKANDGTLIYTRRDHERRETKPAGENGADPEFPLSEPLSERELEVLALLASGRTNSEIARNLFVAVGTVKSHTANIYRKLDAKNRAEALTRARELKLLP